MKLVADTPTDIVTYRADIAAKNLSEFINLSANVFVNSANKCLL